MEDIPDEQIEEWRQQKELAKKKKKQNIVNSISILNERGIKYIKFSETHYRIGDYDFWPSTGKYWNKKINEKGRGIFNLLKVMK